MIEEMFTLEELLDRREKAFKDLINNPDDLDLRIHLSNIDIAIQLVLYDKYHKLHNIPTFTYKP